MKAEGLPQSQQNVFGEPMRYSNDPLTGSIGMVTAIQDPMIWYAHRLCAYD